MVAGSAGVERVGRGFVAGRSAGWLLDQIELVVVSPSSCEHHSDSLRGAGRAEVIGEVELAARYLKGRIVAITGSNGKTTTTTLIGELLRDAGLSGVRLAETSAGH